jgi:hypothetical protein
MARRGAVRASLPASGDAMSSDLSPAPPAFCVSLAPRERRGDARRRTRLRVGRALDGEGRFVCEATIVDLSAHGARLRLSDPAALPATLWLYDESEKRAALARVVRRGAGEAGLALDRWRALEELTPATRRRLEAPYFGAR